MDSVQGNRTPNIEVPAETGLGEEMTDFVFDAIGGIFIVLFILGSVAGIVEAYLENKEKDAQKQKSRRREKWLKERTAKNTTA